MEDSITASFGEVWFSDGYLGYWRNGWMDDSVKSSSWISNISNCRLRLCSVYCILSSCTIVWQCDNLHSFLQNLENLLWRLIIRSTRQLVTRETWGCGSDLATTRHMSLLPQVEKEMCKNVSMFWLACFFPHLCILCCLGCEIWPTHQTRSQLATMSILHWLGR